MALLALLLYGYDTGCFFLQDKVRRVALSRNTLYWLALVVLDLS